jgi:hypothetical protein
VAALAAISWSLAKHSSSLDTTDLSSWASRHSRFASEALERELVTNGSIKAKAWHGSRSHVAATLAWSYARLGIRFPLSSSKLSEQDAKSRREAYPGLLPDLLKALVVSSDDHVRSTSVKRRIRLVDLSVMCSSLLQMDTDLLSIDDNLVQRWLSDAITCLSYHLGPLSVPLTLSNKPRSSPRPPKPSAAIARGTLSSLARLLLPLIKDASKIKVLHGTFRQLGLGDILAIASSLNSPPLSPYNHLKDLNAALATAASFKLTGSTRMSQADSLEGLSQVLIVFSSPLTSVLIREEVKRALLPVVISWLKGHRNEAKVIHIEQITAALIQVSPSNLNSCL